MKDLFGRALLDYHQHKMESPLLLHTAYGPPEKVPLARFFEGEDKFSDLDNFALAQVQGKILDIGAATGRHALYLQNREHDITAMDISEHCVLVMKGMGVGKIINEDINYYKGQEFDTIIMLMNGIGLAGTIEGLEKLLRHLTGILKPTGQLLFDSPDISYLYENKPLPENRYFGQLSYKYQYKNMMDAPFHWLYIDRDRLAEIANATGWNCQVIFQDETGAYLARLQRR